MNNIDNFCPVCGFDLGINPWTNNSSRDEVICPCCSVQFGYHDAIRNNGSFNSIVKRYSQLRKEWISRDGVWESKVEKSPVAWNREKQLSNII